MKLRLKACWQRRDVLKQVHREKCSTLTELFFSDIIIALSTIMATFARTAM
ncbi:MAG: hypothetical protein MUE44_30400 [Oscillatoriaceae cyanobacterium Prado104]|nr:hypothetical protein [Oscillatoriaceae cyanobacterium Prado104]